MDTRQLALSRMQGFKPKSVNKVKLTLEEVIQITEDKKLTNQQKKIKCINKIREYLVQQYPFE